jgi:site-specific DNA-methyltransferase (adenine-specific)
MSSKVSYKTRKKKPLLVKDGTLIDTTLLLKKRAPRNQTITLSSEEKEVYRTRLVELSAPTSPDKITNKTIHQDLFGILDWLPAHFVDLLFIDPPYNLTKEFNSNSFREMSSAGYKTWFEKWFVKLLPALKSTASVYICGDWRSYAIQEVIEKHLILQNRISWEREKGRGAKANWKNCSEDIWFATVSNKFTFNADAVKLKRKVIAPYTDSNGNPKDWEKTSNGNYRLTHPSNVWTDLTIPFWSMPENTDHPTQKPEKLLAKIILASSKPGDFIFDPFLGSGTTSVVASKLGRKYAGVEIDGDYCCITEKRLHQAENDKTIQGYHDGVFWERNTLQEGKKINGSGNTLSLF